MKLSHFITLIIIVVAWGSLFITELNQVSKIRQILDSNTKTLTAEVGQSQENQAILKSLQTIASESNSNTDSIHQQINCVLQFFSQSPTARNNSTIVNPQACIITPSSSGSATGSTKSAGPVNVPTQPAPVAHSAPVVSQPTSKPTSTLPTPPSAPTPSNPTFLHKIINPVVNLLKMISIKEKK